MRRLLLGLMLILFTVGWNGAICAQGLEVNIKSKGFRTEGPKEPSSAAIFADALIGRPVGLATTIVGGAVFAATLPFTLPSGEVRTAGKGLVVKPAGWTFRRPLGGSNPKFKDEGIFSLP